MSAVSVETGHWKRALDPGELEFQASICETLDMSAGNQLRSF